MIQLGVVVVVVGTILVARDGDTVACIRAEGV